MQVIDEAGGFVVVDFDRFDARKVELGIVLERVLSD